MQDNPFSKFVELFKRDDVKLRMYRGTVTSKTPLEMSIAGITVSGSELLLNATLVLDISDTVLVLSEDNQLFYVICKVVAA
jgi:hypothetical protein